jgi:hypothetical protein
VLPLQEVADAALVQYLARDIHSYRVAVGMAVVGSRPNAAVAVLEKAGHSVADVEMLPQAEVGLAVVGNRLRVHTLEQIEHLTLAVKHSLGEGQVGIH